jgi:hypothetical protein
MAANVTYNGDTNNFTGEGTVNPEKLTLPYIDRVPDPQTRAALLRIQQYINNLLAPGSGGAYASLTGVGETTTPGKLTQLGDFTVSDNGVTGSGIQFTTGSTGSLPIFLSASDGIVNGNLATITLSGSGTGDVAIQAGHGAGAVIHVTAAGTSPGTIALDAPELGFFGGSPVAKQVVNGSRGGNAALTSLLSALATAGLITDSTTP